MKKRVFWLLTAMLLLAASCAGAQTLPGIDCFSPGLVRLNGTMKENPPVSVQAAVSVDNAAYARDLSVLRAMLSGTTLCYESETGAESLSIVRDGQTLFSAALAEDEAGAALAVNDRTFRFASAQEALRALPAGAALTAIDAAGDPLGGLPLLERVPLERVAAFFESLQPGDEIAAGYHAQGAFSVTRTMSDDGTRLTRIEIAGRAAREGEPAWEIAGWMRQPAGRAPKDSFEVTITQDEDNMIELLYSSLRENTVTSKNKAGETRVDTTLKAAGKRAGSGFSSRLRVKQTNRWTADGENLNERITVSATLTHQDKTPDIRMLRLNQVDGTMKNVITLKTAAAGSDVCTLHDELTLELLMDSNTVLAGGASIDVQVGGGERGMAQRLMQAEPAQGSAGDAVSEAVQALSQKIYPMLDEDTQEKIEKGL